MASGDTLAIFTPQMGVPASSNYPTLDLRNLQPVLDFDAATIETVYFFGVLPRNYAGGGLTITVGWMATSATSGVTRWGASMERHNTATDRDADSFATEQVVDSTAPGTSGYTVYAAITMSSGANMDSLAAGEGFRLRITRVANHANDTMTGDAELSFVEIKET